MSLKVNKKELENNNQELSNLMAEKEQLLNDIRDKNVQLEELATHDILTHLPNRLQFENTMAKSLAESIRNNRLLCLLFLDLDGFKNINDSFGHDIGDLLLIEIAKRFRTILRKEDFIARLGGDEFAVILTNLQDVAKAEKVAQKIIATANKPVYISNNELFIGVSIGIAAYPDSGRNWRNLVKDADIAMYRAKQDGRNTYRLMTSGMNKQISRSIEMEHALSCIFNHKELFLVYQPRMSLDSKQLTGIEVGMRWHHSKLGEISDNEFMPVVERVGMVEVIERWMLNNVLRQCAKWNENGYKDYKLTLRVMPSHLLKPEFVELLKHLVKQYDIPVWQLEFELTEGALLKYGKSLKQVLAKLGKLKIGIALNDIGSGYSTISRLGLNLPIRTLKLEEALIRNIGTNTTDELIIKAAIALASGLGMQTVAVGVCTEAQEKFLMYQHCNEAQGAFYCVPLEATKMTKYLAEYLADARKAKQNNIGISTKTNHDQSINTILELTNEQFKERNEQILKEMQNNSYRLSHVLTHDLLTDLPNRFVLEKRLRTNLVSAKRKNSMLALLFLDIDHFKSINDNLGYDVGNLLIKAFAKRLKKHDGVKKFVVRLSGDEFAIIFSRVDSIAEINKFANKIRDDISKPYVMNGHSISISVSIGVACYPDSGIDRKDLMKNADIALYHAKEQGGNIVQHMTEKLAFQHKQQFDLENQLHLALKHQELFLLYQPLIELKTGKMFGMEVLMRWQRSTVIMPEVFIPIAEKTGLINELGEWLLKTSCNQYNKWFTTKVQSDQCLLSINLSAKQLDHEKIAQVIASVLKEEKVTTSRLILELTESAIMRPEAKDILQKLNKIGVKIAIDDFGTGYSSLSRLGNLPIYLLKVDKSFVQNIGKDTNNEIIIKSIIGLANSLGVKILAEGIETKKQLDFLLANGCVYGQGFYFSRPLTAEQMTKYIAEQKL